MCTLTYLPLPQQGSWLFTTNRDESPMRPTLPPSVHNHGEGIKLLYPKDEMAGGSWIIVSGKGRAACILNGAFVRHYRKPPYRKSRGLIILELFDYPNTQTFLNEYDLNNIEPFTMVIVDGANLYDLRWDGQQRHIEQLDSQKPHLWASPTLYTAEWIEKRQQWFKSWLHSHPKFERRDIVDFHLHAGIGDPMNDLVMNRYNMVRTVSITSLEHINQQTTMQYLDLLQGQDTIVGF
jgi:uncharacterized protein with NRDE domain